ncbi:MAG: amidohydrolase family protein [Planctomycetota bacterium]
MKNPHRSARSGIVRRSFAHIVSALGVLLLTAVPSAAQDLIPKPPAQEAPVLLVGGTVHTVSGPVIEDGLVMFDGGKLTRIGSAGELASMTIPTGVRQIDVTGHHVYPGLIAPETPLGLTETSSVRDTVDFYEIGDMNPEVRAVVAMNPDSTLLPVTMMGGVLIAGVMPSRGMMPGRAGVARLAGWTNEDMTIDGDAGLVINWPRVRTPSNSLTGKADRDGQKRADASLESLDAMFDTAEAYAAAKAVDQTTPTDLRLEALRPYIDGDKPLLISANDYDRIVSAVTWAADRGYRVVLMGGRDAPLCSELLAANDVAVITGGTHAFPKRADLPHDHAFTLPSRLRDAGLAFCIGVADRAGNERNLPHEAGMAARYGLTPAEAVRAITLSAAEIFGIDGQYGSLDTGKSATLIVADGDILEVTTRVRFAFIDGREIPMRSKQTDLHDKYRERYEQLGIIEKP